MLLVAAEPGSVVVWLPLAPAGLPGCAAAAGPRAAVAVPGSQAGSRSNGTAWQPCRLGVKQNKPLAMAKPLGRTGHNKGRGGIIPT